MLTYFLEIKLRIYALDCFMNVVTLASSATCPHLKKSHLDSVVSKAAYYLLIIILQTVNSFACLTSAVNSL